MCSAPGGEPDFKPDGTAHRGLVGATMAQPSAVAAALVVVRASRLLN
jgi:hypothetical protein